MRGSFLVAIRCTNSTSRLIDDRYLPISKSRDRKF